MPIHWTHITLTVSDIERSIKFYESFCDLEVLKDRRKEGGGTVWLGPKPGPGKLPTFLLVIGQGEVDFLMDHLGFQCGSREDLDSIAERGRKSGILVHPPTDSGGVVGYWTMIKDPDGHQVEFTYGQPIEGIR